MTNCDSSLLFYLLSSPRSYRFFVSEETLQLSRELFYFLLSFSLVLLRPDGQTTPGYWRYGVGIMSDQLSYANLAVALAFSNLINVSFWLKGRCQEREKISKFPDFVFRQTTDKIQPFSKSF